MKNEHDPSNWIWHLFYYNKDDNRIFPPKGDNLGWTINFANPLSVIVNLAIFILIMLFIQILSGQGA